MELRLPRDEDAAGAARQGTASDSISMPRIRRASAGTVSPPGSPSQPQAAGGTTADTKNRSGGTPVPAVRWGKVDRRRSGRALRRSPSPGAPRPESQAHRRARQVSPDACGAGLFPEGGAIDRLDKKLSAPVFRLRTSRAMEAAIAVPGSIFGVMVLSLIMVPTWLLVILDPGDLRFHGAITVPVTIWAGHRVRLWLQDPRNKELVFLKKSVVFNGFIHIALAGALSRHSDAPAALAFYFCTWFYSQATNQAIKQVFWRRRPTACFREDKEMLAPRHFPQFKIMLMDRPDSLESFPSGDAAGAASFGYAAMLFTGSSFWLLVTVAGCFGRVFLHVHHLLDVVAGALVGFSVAAILDWSIPGGSRNCRSEHLLLCTLVYSAMFLWLLPVVKRRKREQQLSLGILWPGH